MSQVIIRNARLVNEGAIQEADVLVAHGRIEKIGRSIAGVNAPLEIDARGQWLLPRHDRRPGSFS